MNSIKILVVALCLGTFPGIVAQDFEADLKHYRDSVDQQFASGEGSILLKEDRVHFEGLDYFEADEKFKVSIWVELIENGEPFEMQTSTDRLPVYVPYAKLHFELDGESHALTAYQNLTYMRMPDHEDDLFIPFNDLTNGVESYGGGRYLEVTKDDIESGFLDFNYCFNPYCSYNPNYSCPIPPEENMLNVRIEAGVKKWH